MEAVGTRVPPVKVTLRSGPGFFLTAPRPQVMPSMGQVRVGAEPDLELANGDQGLPAGEPKGVGALEGFCNTAHIVRRDGGFGLGLKPTCSPSEPETGVCHSHTVVGSAGLIPFWALPCAGCSATLPASCLLTVGGHTQVVSVTRPHPGLSAGWRLGLPPASRVTSDR